MSTYLYRKKKKTALRAVLDMRLMNELAGSDKAVIVGHRNFLSGSKRGERKLCIPVKHAFPIAMLVRIREKNQTVKTDAINEGDFLAVHPIKDDGGFMDASMKA